MLAKSFPYLIYDLMAAQHQERILRMHLHSHIPYSTLWRWLHGSPTRPSNIRRLCEAYSLKERDVWELIHRDEMLRMDRKDVPLPDLSHITAGPMSREEEKARSTRQRQHRPSFVGLGRSGRRDVAERAEDLLWPVRRRRPRAAGR